MHRRRRSALAPVTALAVGALSLSLLWAMPAHAAPSAHLAPSAPAAATAPDDAEWESLPGYPVTVDDLDIAFFTSRGDADPLGLSAGGFARPVPLLGFSVTNSSTTPRVVGLGTDLATAGIVEPLWDAATWGDSSEHRQLHSAFAIELAPGQTWPEDGGFLAGGLAQWPGRTVAVLELDGLPQDGGQAVAELAAVALPGRFVPVRVDGPSADEERAVETDVADEADSGRTDEPGDDGPGAADPGTTDDPDGTADDGDSGDADSTADDDAVRAEASDTGDEEISVGSEAAVLGAVGLFPGATATLEAGGLPAGELLEVWLAPEVDAFTVQLQGGVLPATAIQVGAGTVSAEGTLRAEFTVPSDATRTGHTLLVGTASDRFWPASSRAPISVAEAPTSAFTVADAGAASVALELGGTSVTVSYTDATSAGRVTGTLSPVGPEPVGFAPTGSAGPFVHLSAALDSHSFTVCLPDAQDAPAAVPDEDAAADDTTTGDADERVANSDDAAVDDTADFAASGPARLYQHQRVGAFDHRWVELTDTDPAVDAGEDHAEDVVCAQTPTLGVFALGHPIDDGAEEPPAAGVLSHDNDGPLASGDFSVTMDLFSGENARAVRLYEDGELVAHRYLEADSPQPQQARFALTGRADGTYVYEAELENSRGVTTTEPLTVTVSDAAPAIPALSLNGPRGGSFTLTARILWGTNATSYVFYESGVPVAEGALEAATPGAQEAELKVAGQPPGTYSYTVGFRNDAGETLSSAIEVVIP